MADESLDAILDDIAQIGPGGHFLGTDHTRENPMHMNPLQNNDSFEQWEAEGSKTAETVGNEEAQRMLDHYVRPPMPDDQRGALDEFVAKKRLEYQNS